MKKVQIAFRDPQGYNKVFHKQGRGIFLKESLSGS